jgi:hypothetical protein
MLRLQKISWIVFVMIGTSSVILLSGLGQVIYAAQGGGHHAEYLDSRFHHDHYYPERGRYISALPPGHRVFVHGGARFYYHGGVWYRAAGPRFLVVAPPIGIVVPFLPPFYTTIWIGGSPYYYANEVYYAQALGGYTVVDPPKGETGQPSAQTDRVFIYARQGQSEQLQAKDQYECHRWAVGQTGFDPTQPAGAPDPRKRLEYQRAMSACLDARGYTVK